MEIFSFYTALLVIVLLLDVWAINSVWRSPKDNGSKAGWTVLILIAPVLGLVIWGITGPRGVAKAPTSPSHSKG
ncbi:MULTISPECIES: PLD nuclease N-terminal domain-containing protein [unclassified Pseudomonas]|uniref:PLD nuclease N-terminal domain-containing protein n=1 Tax=unclassified Pseudomonas TaxID=196821 RepID=UPI000BDC8D4F|nr:MULTISPECIES: PLD nuclease N-terminal domain-containing protein [unclassified Pseudomonas]PVZ19571.1 phospholipase D-like protein [Pseudomonas sp. URIL14HWK12:I12]PVZ22844.1 phospholipase D-like protein [Pseudomonas sp. URIL14HWK12:I10]PVZ37526.1 phospholipase D-like protein [Pseudomonas sp. URIL14HWK12:I11]SNZ15007.1 Phospholipase_D-nuclease N-terminal [Pseudomonas sp. URIL14HWK12:I9]